MTTTPPAGDRTARDVRQLTGQLALLLVARDAKQPLLRALLTPPRPEAPSDPRSTP